MSATLVMPSDIAICEEKCSIGKRKLSLLEWTGLFCKPWMLHMHYSKLDQTDMRAILKKKYDPEDKKPEAHVCMRRQEAVSRYVQSYNYMWGTAWTMTGLTWWSFRRYNYQSRLIALPFVFYGGTFVGRILGDICTGRNAEYARDRFLASLPAKVYLAGSES